jgi:hypothetical protein
MDKRHYGRVAGVIVAAACLIAPATAAAASPLRGWWPMNERSGQTVYDWSGNRNHGQLGSTPGTDANDPTWIKGIFNLGSALNFDGEDDFVTIPDSPSLRPARVTVSAWFRRDRAIGAYKYIVAKGSDNCEASSFALYTTENNRIAFYVYDGNGWVRSPEAADSVWDGRWHHLAGTYDGSTVRLFVDGTQVGSGTPANISIKYDLPSPASTLGSYQGSSCSTYLVGDIDGVSIWDRALPISDISALVRSLVGGR